MPTDKPRVMLTLDEGAYGMLKQLADRTDLSVAGVISRFLGAHMHETAEFLAWIEKQKEGSSQQVLGKNLMQSYGPDGLISGIRRLDSKHKFVVEKFNDRVRAKR